MSLFDHFQKIFNSSFKDPEPWRRWFFSHVVVNEEEVKIGYDTDGKAASALLMQPYDFLYHGSVLPANYISCVSTLPAYRGKGLAGALLRSSLQQAFEGGVVLSTLIPAQRHLFFLYRKYGYAGVFYVDEMRYTAAHSFEEGRIDGYTAVEPTYELFHELELKYGCGILHSELNYKHILEDLAMDGGAHVVAVQGPEDEKAILFASDGPRQCDVKCLLSTSGAASDAALALLRAECPDKAVRLWCPPVSGEQWYLRCRGMARIVNVEKLLQALAGAHKELRCSIRVSDPIIAANNATFVIAQQKVSRRDDFRGRPDLDVSIHVLAAILFNKHETGRIFNLPSRRPYMALMLD